MLVHTIFWHPEQIHWKLIRSGYRDATKALSPAQKAHIVSGIYRSHRGQQQHPLNKESSQPELHSTVFRSTSNMPSPAVPPTSWGSQAMASSLSQHAYGSAISGSIVSRTGAQTPGQRCRIGKPSVPPWASERQRLLSGSGRKEPGTSLLLHTSWENEGLDTEGQCGGADNNSSSRGADGSGVHQNPSEQCNSDTETGDDQNRSTAMRRYAYYGSRLHSILH